MNGDSGGELDPEHRARFDAAVARARSRPAVTPLWLSHHYPDAYERCVRIGSRHLCRRCLMLYPLAFAVAALALAGVTLPDPWSMVALVVLPVPALVELVVEQVGGRAYDPRRQAVVTVPLGLGLGVGFSRYLADTTDPWFWGVTLGYSTVGLAAVWWRWRR